MHCFPSLSGDMFEFNLLVKINTVYIENIQKNRQLILHTQTNEREKETKLKKKKKKKKKLTNFNK